MKYLDKIKLAVEMIADVLDKSGVHTISVNSVTEEISLIKMSNDEGAKTVLKFYYGKYIQLNELDENNIYFEYTGKEFAECFDNLPSSQELIFKFAMYCEAFCINKVISKNFIVKNYYSFIQEPKELITLEENSNYKICVSRGVVNDFYYISKIRYSYYIIEPISKS